ncbi:MAG TPA: SCE4755 family polysaccharide monooxygenase-like protein [Vicinamibacterales bacterium]|nr:SCE4755 family polysaccharide monooxygenase-like protein [Vicinamibacterales bacterium]
MKNLVNGLLFASVAAVTATTVSAHFKLISPASWIVEDMRGDPQKIAPCGGTMADAGTPTNAVTKVQGGQKLHIEVDETIFHPGHYRIALARTRAGLPPDPEVTTQQTEKGPRSVSAAIATNPQPPVLVDGLWPHTERPTAKWTTDIDIPNISCEKCTLQIIEFMANHPGVREGGFSYHHCADLQITADSSKPIDKRW